MTSSLDIALVVAVSAAAWFVVRRSVRAVVRRGAVDGGERSARIRTVGTLLQSFAGYGIAFVALLTVLSHLGVDTTALVTAAGVFSIAIGLGARSFISDVIGGIFIILEDQFSVGDLVTLGAGPTISALNDLDPLTVEAIGIRTSRFRDADGRLVIVGNGGITSVVNHSRGPLSVRVDLLLRMDVPLRNIRRSADSAALMTDASLWAERPRFARLVEAPESRLKVRIGGVAAEGKRAEAEAGLREALQDAFLRYYPGAAEPSPAPEPSTPVQPARAAAEDDIP